MQRMARVNMDWKLKKIGPTLSSFDAMPAKSPKNWLLGLALLDGIALDIFITLRQHLSMDKNNVYKNDFRTELT